MLLIFVIKITMGWPTVSASLPSLYHNVSVFLLTNIDVKALLYICVRTKFKIRNVRIGIKINILFFLSNLSSQIKI